MHSRYCILPVLVLVMVLGQSISGNFESNLNVNRISDSLNTMTNNKTQPFGEQINNNPQEINNKIGLKGDFLISEIEILGVLNPVSVEQSGYFTTGNVSAQTDTKANIASNLSLDVENGWIASRVEVDVWDLNRLYAVNGSFDDGIGGINMNWAGSATYHPFSWDATRNTTDTRQIQVASYVDSGSHYVTVENRGWPNHPNFPEYEHYAGTCILWNQTFNNTPFTEDFKLSFNYLYAKGPLSKSGGDSISGNCSIAVYVDGVSVWNNSLLTLAERDVWHEVTQIPISVPQISNESEIMIGLIIDEDMILDPDADYDNDGTADGLINTFYITVEIDDVSLIKSTNPIPTSVDLQINVENEPASVIGTSGSGSASIVNESYWIIDPVTVEFFSNVSVSLNYEARLLCHRFLNSTWTTSPAKEGVAYSCLINKSPDLSAFTYVGTIGNYEDFAVKITYPKDWENITVYDPFLNNVTNQCITGDDFITIPESLLDILGWWKVELETPNYAKSIDIQKYEPLSTEWVSSSKFRSWNTTRAAITLGTINDIPILSDPVNITWTLPNDTLWSSESLYSAVAGKVNSSKRILGPLNTSAGEWSVEVHWTNGTEVAYGSVSFAMFHGTTLTPKYTEIESEVGPIITNFLTFVDADNGEYLMDDTATIVGIWSELYVEFAPNLLRNWWEGDFNTLHVGGGVFLVTVNSSLPYYDNATCQFTISCTYSTTLNLRDDSTVEIEFQETYEIVFYYKYTNGTGISGASISFEYSGPENGLLNSSPIEHNIGNYSINVTGLKIGTYSISISASKQYHEIGTDQFTLIVNEVGTELTLVNGTIGSIGYLKEYRLVVRYTNCTGYGLTGATVTNVSITPKTGLNILSRQEIGDGNYSIVMQPTVTETFTILIQANLTNHETQFATFVLTTTAIPTILILNSTIEDSGVTETYTVKITYRDDLGNGIDDANITIVNPPAYLSFSEPVKLGDGNYTITIDPSNFGTYLITIAILKENYQSRVDSFSLTVDAIETELIIMNGTAGFSQYQKNYTLVIKYLNSTGHGLPGATVQIIDITPATGLINYAPQDKNDGNYSIILKPNATTTFTILIQVNLTAHETKYGTFTLTGTAIPTSLKLNISAASIPYGDQCVVLVSFMDDDSNGLEVAFINVTASEGIGNPVITELANGNYTLTIIPIEQGAYIITVSATKDNYHTQFQSFSLSVEEIETYLDVLNGTSAQVEYGENFRVVVYYTNILNQGLAGATVQIDSVNPETGLINGTTIPGNNGYYSIVITPTVSSVLFTIVIKAELTNHQPKLVTFTLSAIEASTDLILLNDSVDSIRFGEVYNLTVQYKSSSGIGLSGADIVVVNVFPSVGLSIDSVIEGEDGYYTILLTPDIAESFILTLRANLTNYETLIITFTLIVNKISTILALAENVDSVAMDRNYTVQLFFADADKGNGLENANILIMNPFLESEFIFSDVLELGDGYYSITIIPRSEVQLDYTYTISFRACLANHQNSTARFSLVFTLIQTTLNFENGTSSASIDFLETYEIILSYVRTDSNDSILGAIIEINSQPNEGLNWRFFEEENAYHIIITAIAINTWELEISAYKPNYRKFTLEFTLTANEIDTSLEFGLGPSVLIFNRSVEYIFSYYITSNDSGIEGVTIKPSGDAYEWVSYTLLEDGNYSISILPRDIGNHSVKLSFEKYGFKSRQNSLQFLVTKIPIEIGEISGLSGTPNQHITLKVKLIEGELDDEIPVIGADVKYAIVDPDGLESIRVQMDDMGDGIYQAIFTMPDDYARNWKLRVYILKDNHYFVEGSYHEIGLSIINPYGLLGPLVPYFDEISIISIILMGVISSQRIYSKRKRKQNLEALAIKRRFDDLKNLIGIIVLHKTSGLPIYSNMLTEGFDSSMISAFITAIRTFRSEIEQDSEEPQFDLIPISDIVRVVSTRTLLCAFITVTRPTPSQSERMIVYARAVGFQFDDVYDRIPAEVIDQETTDQFTYLFDNLMDGRLLKKFRMAERGKFPRRLKCVEKKFEHLEAADGFDLDDLAVGVASCGLEEARAYKIIMDYIEKGTIVPLNLEEKRILDLGWEIDEEKRGA